MIDREFAYIGLSQRTTKQAIRHITHILPQYEVMSIPFTDKYLHLDCIFNVLSPKEAILYPGEIPKEDEAFLSSLYDLIKVTKEEQQRLATNILSIGNKRVFSIPENYLLNQKLKDRGYEVIELDFLEIIKGGGSFRCCTLPLEREKYRS